MIEDWWPTQIGFYDNIDHNKIEKDLSNHCLNFKNKHKKGGTNWLSQDTYNTSDGVFDVTRSGKFKTLNKFVYDSVEKYIDETGMIYKIKKKDGWFNVYNKDDFQELHDHTPFVISAVYFLKSKKTSSKIYFQSNFKDQLNINYKTPRVMTQSSIFYEPLPGRLLVFRSYLPHFVEKNKLEEKRITIAYNFT